MVNYLRIESRSLFFQKYAFLDHKHYKCDNIFCKDNIFVLFGREYARSDFRVIFVRVLRRDIDKFENAMEKLNDTLTLVYGNEYIQVCDRFEKLMDE